MRAVIEQLIRNLLSTDNASILKATNDLNEAYNNPQTIPSLCDIIVTSPEKPIRQYAAVLLTKRLGKLRYWRMVPPEQQEFIKKGILRALVEEQEKSVRNSIAQFVGALVRHEADKKDDWLKELMQFIYTNCSSTDPKQSELGSSIFATLADAAPDQFVPELNDVCNMLTQALTVAEANGNLATPVIANILTGMTFLEPFVLGHTVAEHTIIRSIPLILKALHAFAYQSDPELFSRSFEIMDSIAEFTPKLLHMDFNTTVELCLEIARNKQLHTSVRVQTMAYLSRIVRLKKKAVAKPKLIEPILLVIFNVMSEETGNDEDIDDVFGDDDNNSTMTAATQLLDLLAIVLPAEKLIPPLLNLLEPALRSDDIYARNAAYLSMAVIAEGCSEAICSKYIANMLNIIKVGINDKSLIVRNAAFFAMGQFSEHLQPKISKYSAQILPVLFDFLHQMTIDAKHGKPDPKHIDRMFYALETFVENLEDDILPHLPILMERLFEALQPSNSVHLRELALCTSGAVANAAKQNIMPYFQQLIGLMQPYLIKSDNEELLKLRIQTIDTLAALARSIGKENFMPLASDTMALCSTILEDTENDEPDLRRAVYNMIGSLAAVVNEEMAPVLPKLVDRVIQTVISLDELMPCFKEDDGVSPLIERDDAEINIEDTDDEEDSDGVDGFTVENDYLEEKEEAIICLKEFAENTGSAFGPYLELSFENVYKMVEHPNDCIRKACIDSLRSFVLALSKLNNDEAAKKACEILIPKLLQIVRDDEDICVAICALDALNDILRELGKLALPSQELGDNVFKVINDVLFKKIVCQFDESSSQSGGDDDDNDESEFDESLLESAANLLPVLGETVGPQRFKLFFTRMYPYFLNKIKKTKKDEDYGDLRAFLYGVLAECCFPLEKYAVDYFDSLFPLMLGGLNDKAIKVRQNAYFGLGELVLHTGEKSYGSYPTILQALSGAISNEKERVVVDNVCGAIARLISNNHSLVPLEEVVPVLLNNMPLTEDTDEHEPIFKCFKILFIKARYVLLPHMEHLLAVIIHILYKKEFPDSETFDIGVSLIKEIQANHNASFLNVANTNPEVYSFVQSM